jgi:hypothetical protein
MINPLVVESLTVNNTTRRRNIHFKVPVFWEILPLSEQNRMIKTPSPNTKF